MTTRRYITLREIAQLLHKEYQTVWRWTKDGRLPSVKVGGSVLVDEEVFNQWIEDRTNHG